MTGSFFDQFPDRREELSSGPGQPPAPAAPFGRRPADPDTAPLSVPGAEPFAGVLFGEVPFVDAPRGERTRGRRMLVAVGSLTAGAVAASGAAFALSGGAEPGLAAATVAGEVTPPGSAAEQDDVDDRADEGTSRTRGRGDRCVRLDARTLAAIDSARAAGAAGRAAAAGPAVRVRTDKGDVLVPMSAVKVVSCAWPKPKPSTSETTKKKPAATPKPSATTSTSSSPRAPKPSSSSSAPRPKPSTSTSAPKPKPSSTTSTKPAPKPTTTTPTPKPTTSSGS